MQSSSDFKSRLPLGKLESIEEKFINIQEQLIQEQSVDELIALNREFTALRPVVEKAAEFKRLLAEIDEAKDMLLDPEMKELAEEELDELTQQLSVTENDLLVELLPKDTDDEKSVVLEIRAGTGGDEAALFCGDLYRMYERYAELMKWNFEPLDANESDLGGFKEITVTIEGKGVYARLKYESGVHRVQRVPQTESSGRVHTSAATVAVLPEAEEVDIKIAPEDLRIDTMRASGAGGQHVNKTDSAVRITHIPTGIAVVSAEKSQHFNRAKAMTVLRSRLYNMEAEKVRSERAADRKSQVGSGDRSERIRTYNFPQGRVTDHRVNLTLYSLDKVLEGDLDEIINYLVTNDQATKLAEFVS